MQHNYPNLDDVHEQLNAAKRHKHVCSGGIREQIGQAATGPGAETVVIAVRLDAGIHHIDSSSSKCTIFPFRR